MFENNSEKVESWRLTSQIRYKKSVNDKNNFNYLTLLIFDAGDSYDSIPAF